MKTRLAALVGLAVTSALPAAAQTQNADDQAVRTADAAFYAALSSRNEAAMDPLWVHPPYVAVIHPDSKAPVVGWEAVRQSFIDGIKATAALTVTPNAQTAHRDGNMAWVVGTEAVHAKDLHNTEFQFTVLVTNVYEYQNGHWLMVVHHASSAPK